MRRAEQGFTLIEVLIALVVFAIVAIGALAALGATTASGFLGAFPTSFSTVRVARDYTTAAVYLQTFQEFVASLPSVTPVSQTVVPPGASMPFGAPPPPPQSELKWTQLDVCVERWSWNVAQGKYVDPDPSGCSTAIASGDYITLVWSTLTWTFKDEANPGCPGGKGRCLTVNRFIP